MQLELIPVKTRILNPPKDEIWDIIDGLQVKDGDIVFITSKILGIHQGRCVKVDSVSKEELIKQEATAWLPYTNKDGYHCNLTIMSNTLVSSAGIDESNANGYYVMWPKNIDALCREIRKHLMKRHGLKRLGVVSTDSCSTPLRLGASGVAIGLAGLKPLRDMRGKPDLFGRELKVTRVNLLEPLAAMAVLVMGECAEQTPILIIRGWNDIEFCDNGSMDDIKIPPEHDLFQPLLEVMTK